MKRSVLAGAGGSRVDWDWRSGQSVVACRLWQSLYQWRHLGNIGASLCAEDNETISRVGRLLGAIERTTTYAGRRDITLSRRNTCRQMQATDSGSIRFSARLDHRLRGHDATAPTCHPSGAPQGHVIVLNYPSRLTAKLLSRPASWRRSLESRYLTGRRWVGWSAGSTKWRMSDLMWCLEGRTRRVHCGER